MKCNDHPLSLLAHAPAERLKCFADTLRPKVGAIDVLTNKVGIAHLSNGSTPQVSRVPGGEWTVAEARIYLSDLDVEGYGARMGRDTECALALAVIDAAFRCGIAPLDMDAFLKSEVAARL